jgi:hypothetical protein
MAWSFMDILLISGITGISASAVTFTGILMYPYYDLPHWKDIALMGSLGSVIGARFIVNRSLH